MRVLGVKGIVEWMAHEIIHPRGFDIENLRHMQQAAWHGRKPKDAGYRVKKKGAMTPDEIAEANRQVEQDMVSGPKTGETIVRPGRR